jgi:LuxR family transcriptional regulator, maltose regulon positive regulatory protein
VTTQIITTKLFIPSPRPELVSRPRLLERLESGLATKLTLITAQAGFGKTTLLSEWISQCGKPVCWLSLDEGDNDLQRFLKYFIVALQRVYSDLGEDVLVALQSPKSQPTEVLLAWLINDITTTDEPLVFVLDDYHVITQPEIQQLLLFLLDHMPAQMHLIISSRSDPPWPLARLRVRGDILEIRSQEMRFTLQEAATFLNDRMGLALSSQDIAALENRTEGWIVGLQMAALSMHQRPDKEAFIQAFTGSHRYVVDYLVEEVLGQQPPETQEFLLKTSILARLTGSLCDAVLERQNSQQVLIELEHKNLFLIPLDDERRWYRYHHLFADLLRYHLKHTFTGEVLELHKRASLWFEQNDLFADALNHALVSNEIERVVQLTDEMTVYKLDHRELKVLVNWLERLPDSAMLDYPWLLVTRTWALFNLGRYESVEANLSEIERILSTQALSDELANRIRGHAAALRSYLAELREEPQFAMQQAEASLALLPPQDIKLRAFVAIRWANCLVWFGELERAIPVYQEAGESSKRVGEYQLAITALSEMAIVQMFTGKLRQAIDSITAISNYAEALAKRHGRRLPAMGILYRHLSNIKREQNELAGASHYVNEAIKICKQWGEKETLLAGLMTLTRVQFAQGKYEQVDQSFQQINQIASEISAEYIAMSKSLSIHYQLLMGRVGQAESWLQDLGLKTGEDFGYNRQQDYCNYARYLFLRGNVIQALEVLDALLEVVTIAGAGMFIIRYKVLQAIFLSRLNRMEEAMAAMQAALSLARTEGYVRSILDEGEPVGELLRTAIARGIEVTYAAQLLRVFQEESLQSPFQVMQAVGLVDPLSDREVEVLRFLVTDLSAPEIADELYISVSTVRSHIKQIYSKLEAHSRFEAVTKARELNLL